jgi:amidase
MAKKKKVHAFSNDAMGYHDAVGIAELLKRKKVGPREVVEAAINRANLVEKDINAIVSEGFDRANKEAGKRKKGFFAGVPTFIKDNCILEGFSTNHGSEAMNSKPAKKSEPMIRQMMAQGFISLGKSALPEFGFNATTEHANKPPCRNPWNIEFSSGGSSGGSAALVASGVVPIAHGNDGGGSIRIPAACCGLVGLKPTRGRLINNKSAKGMPINIIADGVLTRSVRDTAYFYYEAEKYYRNKKMPELGLVEGPNKRRLRIGYLVDSVTGYPTDSETRDAVAKTVLLLSHMGHHIQYVPIPAKKTFPFDFMYYWSQLAFFMSILGKIIVDPSFKAKRYNDFSKGLARLFKLNFYRTPLFLYRLRKSLGQAKRLYIQENIDAVVTPVLGHTTPEIGYLNPNVPFEEMRKRLLRYVNFTPYANIAGLPAVSLPLGQSLSGLPIGVQLMAAPGDERVLLELAYELEEAAPWRTIYGKK